MTPELQLEIWNRVHGMGSPIRTVKAATGLSEYEIFTALAAQKLIDDEQYRLATREVRRPRSRRNQQIAVESALAMN